MRVRARRGDTLSSVDVSRVPLLRNGLWLPSVAERCRSLESPAPPALLSLLTRRGDESTGRGSLALNAVDEMRGLAPASRTCDKLSTAGERRTELRDVSRKLGRRFVGLDGEMLAVLPDVGLVG